MKIYLSNHKFSWFTSPRDSRVELPSIRHGLVLLTLFNNFHVVMIAKKHTLKITYTESEDAFEFDFWPSVCRNNKVIKTTELIDAYRITESSAFKRLING